jgi:hypothetical protein
MIKRVIYVGLIGLITASCSSSVDSPGQNSLMEAIQSIAETNYNTIEVAGNYSMDIPDFMKSTTALNDEASLQYNNLFKEKYVIVIDEDKAEFIDVFKELGEYDESKSVIENYSDLQISYFKEAGGVIRESKLISKDINGMPSRQIAIDANVQGVDESISYWLGYVEGKESMYSIMAWTLESRKDDFEKEANTMIRSLKELK